MHTQWVLMKRLSSTSASRPAAARPLLGAGVAGSHRCELVQHYLGQQVHSGPQPQFSPQEQLQARQGGKVGRIRRVLWPSSRAYAPR